VSRAGLLLFLSGFLCQALAQEVAQDVVQEAVQETEATVYEKKSTDLQEKQQEILSDIYRMTGRQRKLAAKKSEQLQKREELEADMADLQVDIQDVTKQIQELRKKIILRMRNFHRISAPTIFQSLIGAHDLAEMDRNARIMYKISKSDMEQLRTFRGLKNLLSEQQTKLENKISEFEKTQRNLEKQETRIKKTYVAQMDLLKKLSDQDKGIVEKINELKKQNRGLLGDKEPVLQGLFLGGIYEKKGSLSLPVQGVVTKRFGLLPMNSPKIRVYNKGWFIASALTSTVTSVYKGQVAFVGDWSDYQKVVILDHGDHFYSVYANLAKTNVQLGDDIEALASIGESGASRLYGMGLYFEMRHFSQSEDPAEWFKNSKFNLSSVKEQSL
jgi:murein hydrolase activator